MSGQTSLTRGRLTATMLLMLAQLHHWLAAGGGGLVEGANLFDSWYWKEVKMNKFRMADSQYDTCELSQFDRSTFGVPQLTTEAVLVRASPEDRSKVIGADKKPIETHFNEPIDSGATKNGSRKISASQEFPYEFITLQQLGEARKNRKDQLLENRIDVHKDRFDNAYFGMLEIANTRTALEIAMDEEASYSQAEFDYIRQLGQRYLNFMRAKLVADIAQRVESEWAALLELEPVDRQAQMALMIEEAFDKADRDFVYAKLSKEGHKLDYSRPIQLFSAFFGQSMFMPMGVDVAENGGENSLFAFTGTLVIVHSQQRHLLVVKFGQPAAGREHAKALLVLQSAEPLEKDERKEENREQRKEQEKERREKKEEEPRRKVVDLGESVLRTHIMNRHAGLRYTNIRIEAYRVSQWVQMRPLLLLMVSSSVWTKGAEQTNLVRGKLRQEEGTVAASSGAMSVLPVITPEETINRLSEAVCGYYSEAAVQLVLAVLRKQFQQDRLRQSGLVSLNKFIRQQWQVSEETGLLMAYLRADHDWQTNTHTLCQSEPISSGDKRP